MTFHHNQFFLTFFPDSFFTENLPFGAIYHNDAQINLKTSLTEAKMQWFTHSTGS